MSDNFTPNRGAHFWVGIGTQRDASFMGDLVFVPRRAAPWWATSNANGEKFMSVDHFTPLRAARMWNGNTRDASFSRLQIFVAPAAARFAWGGGRARFSMPDTFILGSAARWWTTPGDPKFEMHNGNLIFKIDPHERFWIVGQPSFAMRAPAPQTVQATGGTAWVWTVGRPAFQTNDLLAKASTVWPFLWDAESSLIESYGYATNVKERFSQTEQRRRNRSKPSGSLKFSVTHLDALDAQRAAGILHANQGEDMVVPRANYAMRAAAPVSIGNLVVVVDDTDSVPLSVGQWVLVYASPSDWELNQIVDWDEASVTLTLTLKKARTAGTFSVIPCVVGRLSERESVQWEALDFATQPLSFEVMEWPV